MKHTLFTVIVALLFAAAPARAANKEHQQLMADIRMLQEQAQLLQILIGTLNESLKAVNTRLDQQAETSRKAFADNKLIVDNLSNDVRVIREKLDDNNVRVGSLKQEVEALRQSLQAAAARPTSPADPDAAAAMPPPAGVPPVGQSPQRMYDSAHADYVAGQYDLAVIGYTEFIKAFPRSELADDAQVAICNAYLQDHKNREAVDACDVAIRTYPNAETIPEAYYRKGLALSNLRDVAGARAAWEFVVKNFTGTSGANFATMAQQGLARLGRP